MSSSWALRPVIRAIGIAVLLGSVYLVPSQGFAVVFGLLSVILIMVS